MSEGFTLENSSGEIIFASSPGMEGTFTSKDSSVKKTKTVSKRGSKKPLIEVFEILADQEIEDIWMERFHKMSMNRFPAKISWTTTGISPGLYGQMVYKNRQASATLDIPKDLPMDELSNKIKFFIRNYTSIDVDTDPKKLEDDIKIVPKSKIKPIPWAKLSVKDQSALLAEYIKYFAIENNIDKEDSNNLLKILVLFSIGKNILAYLSFDEDGKISHINSLIYQDTNGNYKIKH